MCNKIFLKIICISNYSPHLYATFGSCVQIGQLFAAQWVFEHSEEFRNQRHFSSITVICPFSTILQRLAMPRIMVQFGRKKCQKKRKDVNYQLLHDFFHKYFLCTNCGLCSVHMYVCTKGIYSFGVNCSWTPVRTICYRPFCTDLLYFFHWLIAVLIY